MPRAFIQRIGIRKRKLTTTRSTLMRHTLSYRCRLDSSNAEVAFVRANFTAGRGHAWEGGRAPRIGNRGTARTLLHGLNWGAPRAPVKPCPERSRRGASPKRILILVFSADALRLDSHRLKRGIRVPA
jgi:hypothetical protein